MVVRYYGEILMNVPRLSSVAAAVLLSGLAASAFAQTNAPTMTAAEKETAMNLIKRTPRLECAAALEGEKVVALRAVM